MLLGFGAVTSTLGSLVVTFAARDSGGMDPGLKTALLLTGVLLLWACARIRALERLLDVIITRGLERMAHLEVIDLEEMLHLNKGYTVANLPLTGESWLLHKNLNGMALGDEDILILNVERKSGVIIGTPRTHDAPERRRSHHGLRSGPGPGSPAPAGSRWGWRPRSQRRTPAPAQGRGTRGGSHRRQRGRLRW